MTKLVTLKLTGNLDNAGFQVSLEISQDGDRPSIEETGQLPAAPDLLAQLDRHWLENYRPLSAPYRIKSKGIEYGGSIQARLKACQESGKSLRDRLNTWLDAESFRGIDRRLRQQLKPDDDIRVLIRTNDTRLHKLPWHLWSFCQSYPKTEIALSPPKFQRRERFSSQGGRQKIRILAILGHAEGIKVSRDRQILKNLPGAEVEFLDEPTQSEINDQLWDQPWDIIFFAGHSETEGDEGRIHINPRESLTIDELWYALRKAVNQGLQVAIFNSCDGLGLARRLDDLQIPITIVMRELIPDQVAHKFLKYFLLGFADGKPFYQAVREARERLQGMENEFPCASWLPVICQHPWEVPPTWQGLLTPLSPPPFRTSPWWSGLGKVLVASMLVTSLVMGGRSLGWLEQSELSAYDHLLRSRPAETMDERLLLVEITEDDVQSQPVSERGDASLSDRALERLLSILEEHKPRVIGLQVIRESESERPTLQQLMQRENFFHICSFPMQDNTTGVPPAPEVANTNFGFTNLLTDQPDSSIRRHLLALNTPGKSCPTNNSFVFILIKKYLEEQNIAIDYETMKETHELAGIPLQLLDSNSGGYHDFDSGGFQMMINYRNTERISNKLKLNDILSNDFDPGFIRDKIVIIGTTAQSFNDHNKKTPYYSRWGMISGLELQAHTVSQMLSAILDSRPLIRWLSLPQVILWTWLWSLFGGLLAWRWRSTLYLGLATTVGTIVLFSFCWFFLIQGLWVPLIPAALTLLITSVTVAVLFSNRTIQRFFEV
ncbi:hypothetical protein AY600_09470 [Phormidium willei BDU 130791]|nr:hypothetical protein AY600_09470 [Phormidium willei BDU 130791]